jgi:hypothetical protein
LRGLERARPEPPQLAGRSGEHDDDASARRLEDEPRSRAGESERDGGLRARRLLRDAGGEVRIRPPQTLRDVARDRLDLALERLVDDELEPGGARSELDGAVVVGRAEAAGDETRVRREAFPQDGFQLGRRVADDRDPGGLEAVLQRLGGQEGAVPVRALAADELTAGDDDQRAWPRGHPQWT